MYVLHESPDSASTMVRLVLEELGVPYRARRIDRAAGELATTEYRSMQPLGKIPAMETPDGVMFETAAILLYLSETHGRLAPQPGSAERAAFLKWFFFTSTNIHPTLLEIYYPDRTAGEACADFVVTFASDRMKTLLTTLNDMVAAEAPSWLSTEPSIFGYYLAVLMRWLAGPFPAGDYPALQAILAALEIRPAARAVAKAEGLGDTIFTNPA